ncbi:MAG: hypothetical protein VST68_11670 [Nitrospirota bacterium]|nr:hypothetical protein [Nitrospirota bacterium]
MAGFKYSLQGWAWSISVLVLMLMLGGCGGAPDWVIEGSGALNKEDSKSIYGVGSVIGVNNEPLAWEAAENRSRAELAKSFQTYTGYLMKDYAASTTAGDFTQSTEEQDVQRAIKTFTNVTLHGVRPIDRYKDDEKGAYYVLTKLSFKDMQEALAEAKELDRNVREFVQKNGERLFDRLEQEEAMRQVGTSGASPAEE